MKIPVSHKQQRGVQCQATILKNDKESYCGHLYKCITVPEERDRQRTINNICLALLGSDPNQGNIYDVSAFLLRFSSRDEDIKVVVFCAPHFSNLNF